MVRKSLGGDPCQCPKAIAALGPVLLCEECNQPTYMGNGNPRTEIYGGGPAWEHCNCAGAKARVEAKNAAQAKQWAEFEAKKKEESDKEDAARRADWAKMTRQFAKEQAIVNDDAGLADRERVLKGRELSRREQRQDDYDTPPQDDDTTAEGQTFTDFTKEVTLLGVDRLPAAFVRSDWATLAYEGKFNTIFGEVGSGKTWVALMMAIERLHAGRHVIWWDTEDQPSTLARRLQVLRATDLIGHPALKWTNGDFQDNPAIMAEALEGLGSGNGPGLVVIDSATSFGCPSDGGNVAAWLKAFIDPWENAGHSVELLDHVPKQRKDRPRGGIGSQAKLARVDGSALYLHGNPWNATEGGYIHMQIHKNRHGQLPATLMGAAATITAEWDGPTLDYTVGLPNAKAEAENLEDELMDALDQAGPDGVRGGRAVRDLLKGKRAKDIDRAIASKTAFSNFGTEG